MRLSIGAMAALGLSLGACATPINAETARSIGCSSLKASPAGVTDCATLTVERVKQGWNVYTPLPTDRCCIIGGGVIVSRSGHVGSLILMQ